MYHETEHTTTNHTKRNMNKELDHLSILTTSQTKSIKESKCANVYDRNGPKMLKLNSRTVQDDDSSGYAVMPMHASFQQANFSKELRCRGLRRRRRIFRSVSQSNSVLFETDFNL